MFRKWQRSEMAWEQAYREGATMLDVEGRVAEIKKQAYKGHRVVGADMTAEPRVQKRAFKATCKERWDAAKAGVGTELVPTQEQANWPAQRRLMYDRDDGTIHRVAHVGWHDEHQCIVVWIYLMADKDTQMPKVAGKTLDQDQCEAVNMADSVEMINDCNEARRAGELPFDAE